MGTSSKASGPWDWLLTLRGVEYVELYFICHVRLRGLVCVSEQRDDPVLTFSVINPGLVYRGADKSLARPDWKNNWKVAIFRLTQRSLLQRRPGWTDNILNFFLSGLQKLEFGRCSLFPSRSGKGLTRTLILKNATSQCHAECRTFWKTDVAAGLWNVSCTLVYRVSQEECARLRETVS